MSSAEPSKTTCPLCGSANLCGLEAGQATCWCGEVRIAAEQLARIPAELRGKACLCRACAQIVIVAANES
jgi:hypothetical protein